MPLWDSMEKFMNESARLSREAYERTKEYGSLTKLELELRSLQGKLQKEYARLGGHVYHVLVEEGGESLHARDEATAGHLEAIRVLADRIFAKEAEINDLRDGMDERRRNAGSSEE